VAAREAVRAATPDHLPLAGAAGPEAGLHVLAGLGGRGFALAPLLAEHIAAIAAGAPSPLPAPLAAAVHPDRFSRRSAGPRQVPRERVPAGATTAEGDAS
jgi:tRNA 5-methylaminomethyl-2-thiouridine biosynthesis bifunctional protein